MLNLVASALLLYFYVKFENAFQHNNEHEICALVRYQAASCGNCLPTFRDNVQVPSSTVKKMGPIRCRETSVNNYHTTPCNVPEEHRSHQHRGGSIKSRVTPSILTHSARFLCIIATDLKGIAIERRKRGRLQSLSPKRRHLVYCNES
jgi:hypothetical protein